MIALPIFLTFLAGFVMGQIPRLIRMRRAILKTGDMLDDCKEDISTYGDSTLPIIEGRLSVIEELNKLI